MIIMMQIASGSADTVSAAMTNARNQTMTFGIKQFRKESDNFPHFVA
jgi:hypothetical protein